jgi:predicted Zn finger-like uncharacterized protein
VYTQCVKCETVFRLSAQVLRAAGGQVRCGRCGEVFNALARLAEDPSSFPAGESPLEMETRANEILESAVPPLQPGRSAASESETIELEDFDSNDIDFARLQVVDMFVDDPPPPKSASSSAEANVPPAGSAAPAASPPAGSPPAASPPAASPPAAPPPAAPRIAAPARTPASNPKSAQAPAPAPRNPPAAGGSITPIPSQPAPPAAPGSSASATPAQSADDLLDDGSMEFTLPPGELDRVFVERSIQPHQLFGAAGTSSATEGGHADAEMNDLGPGGGAGEPHSLPLLGPGFEVSEDVRQDMLSGISEPALAEISDGSQPRPPAFSLWLGAALLLALLLCAQLLYGNREWLAAHAPWRGPLHGLYTALGVAVTAPANLSAYQLRQWGVTGDSSASGTLRVRASILNTAAHLQPYPLLRVTLANRFGAKIGARDFDPAEYLGRPLVRMLAPGERADATLDIVDPGKDAEGFEIDVCIRGIDQKITCAGDVAAQAKQ